MKKLFLAGAFALLGLSTVNAQEAGFRLGAHVGLPMGDAGDAYSFKLGADVAYMWPVADSFNLGVASGYQAWLGKDISYAGFSYKVPTLSMIPIALSGEYKIADNFGIGADLGYGFVFADGNSDGGFYYQPKLSYSLGDNGALWLGYQGVSKDGFTNSALNLGYTFSLNK